MSFILEELIGQNVKIWSEYGEHEASDEGTLEAFDGTCVKLRKRNGEALYFPIHRVRLIKPA